MKSYDKAEWHIDSGEQEREVVLRFKDVFAFLAEKKLLNSEGLETFELGMDSSVALNSNMVNEKGKDFLDACYDKVLGENVKEMKKNLEDEYKKFEKKNKQFNN